ncbi:protein shisa-9A-like [Myxocyprinus asiaticus]|uniref:protein shisa-9A-like n=1 Tax=Myxocyprinus asiaticus TaxID=70543 RepID=UPI0022223358|nr:protein shisa-9A-like [Myxocyprinus asiaticus]
MKEEFKTRISCEFYQFCCGSCSEMYCCSNFLYKLNDEEQYLCTESHGFRQSMLPHGYGDTDCKEYFTSSGTYVADFRCPPSQFCCGFCGFKFCCADPKTRLSSYDQNNCMDGLFPERKPPQEEIDCMKYKTRSGTFVEASKCPTKQLCCGDCQNKFCCDDPRERKFPNLLQSNCKDDSVDTRY